MYFCFLRSHLFSEFYEKKEDYKPRKESSDAQMDHT